MAKSGSWLVAALLVAQAAATCSGQDEQQPHEQHLSAAETLSHFKPDHPKQQPAAARNERTHLKRHHHHQAPAPPAATGQPREFHDYKTTYACDGNQLELGCPEGKLIHLLRANYGRFSLGICNELGHSNLSVQCFSFRAFLLMESRCNNLGNCSVDVSTDLFGDPCEGTSKYLEVQYYCYDVNNQQTTSALIPGQVPPISANNNHRQLPNGARSQQPSAESVTPFATPSGQADGGHKSHSSPVANPSSGQQQQQVPKGFVGGSGQQQAGEESEDPTNSVILTRRPALQSLEFSPNQPLCRPQQSARNLYWNYTRAGQEARQDCPDGADGQVRWLCDAERLRFVPALGPDFSLCRSRWLHQKAQQLAQLLETPAKQQQSPVELVRHQNEKILHNVLTDLALMAKTKELFGEDLRRVDVMIRQIIAQLRSFTLAFGARPQESYRQLYEDLFTRLASIVSSLFDISQRNAWLELQADESRQLEMRMLNHLKEAGVLLANSRGAAASTNEPQRYPNLFAGISVISANDNQQPIVDGTTESQLKQAQSNLNTFVTQAGSQINELQLHTGVLKELAANGVTRLLVLEARKPDYALMRQQLEAAAESGQLDSNLLVEQQQQQLQQLSSRVFGVFAILGENGDILDGQANNEQQRQQQSSGRLTDLLAQWPISVDFKVSANSLQATFAPNGQAASPAQQQVLRQCNSLSDNANPSNRCHTVKSNGTSHTCRCDQFGFVALTAVPSHSPALLSPDLLWPQLPEGPYEAQLAKSIGKFEAPTYIGVNDKQQAQSLSIWATIFIVFGLSLLVVSLTAFVINALLRSSAQSRLSKKQGFLSTGVLHHRDLSGGPTTGPLVDHNLLGSDPIVSGSSNNNNSGTTQSTSIIGLTQSAYHGYKTHQQLYAAHMPPIEAYGGLGSGGRFRWLRLLRPARWLPSSLSALGKSDNMVQHRVIGSPLTTPGSVSYKSQFSQNGYTTGLHHQSTGASSQVPLAAPSSSTSSYVSSSAYYEEIGPGNLTKVNTNHHAQMAANNPRTHTIIDPFKRQALDQQQLLSNTTGHLQHQQHHLQHQLLQAPWSPSCSLEPQQQHAGHSQFAMPIQATLHGHRQLHGDLSQLQAAPSQSSSSSSGSQHSSTASTQVTSANSHSTPRHLLFASPGGVNAYKSSMSQHTLHHNQSHLQQQQQQQHLCQQQQFKDQDHQRFMPG